MLLNTSSSPCVLSGTPLATLFAANGDATVARMSSQVVPGATRPAGAIEPGDAAAEYIVYTENVPAGGCDSATVLGTTRRTFAPSRIRLTWNGGFRHAHPPQGVDPRGCAFWTTPFAGQP